MTPRKSILIVAAVLLTVVLVLAEKQSPPPGGPPKDFDLPPAKTLTLDNGLRATLVPYGKLPKVTISVRVRAGNLNETAEQVWLADLMGDLMEEGTTTRNAEDLAAAFAKMGGELNIGTGFDASSIGTDVLSDFGPDAVELLAEVVRNPLFPGSELERLKADMVRRVSIAMTRPGPIANQKFQQLLYGDHPYGRVYPTEEMIRSYDLDQVRAFHEGNFGAKRTHVYVVGRFDGSAMERAIRNAFDDWKAGPEPLIAVPEMRSKRAVYVIDRPGAPQSTLRIGLPVIDPSHPDYLALSVTNTLLGGFFSSRVTSNIREDKGYTYSPSSGIDSNYRAADWTQSADVTTAVTGASLKEIFFEIDRLQKEPPSAEELEGVQNYIAGVFVLRNSSRGGIVGQLANVDLHDLSDDHLTTYVKRVYAVSPEDVRAMAEKYLRDEEMTIVVVGDRAQIDAQLKPYGELIP
jgi:predicted Zn-dependent peptidase